MVKGRFTETKSNIQLAVGCSSGVVYLVDSFTFTELFDVGFPITQLVATPSPAAQDWIFCVGQFNSCKVFAGSKVCRFDAFLKNKLMLSYSLPDWAHMVAALFDKNKQRVLLAVALLNDDVHVVSVGQDA